MEWTKTHPVLPVVNCPAGESVGEVHGARGPGARCRVERHTLGAHTEPTSLARYCCGDYTTCPTWRKHKELMIWDVRERSFMSLDPDDLSDLEVLSECSPAASKA